MDEIIQKVIKAIVKISANNEFRAAHKSNPNDFTRERKISFQIVILFVIGLLKTGFDLEIVNFAKIAKLDKIKQFSGAAMSKSRDKVSYTAFRELLSRTADLIPSTRMFKNHTVIAVDGMQGELPNTPELMQDYKASSQSKYPTFHAVSAFDVLNCKFLDAEFMPAVTNEVLCAQALIQKLQNTISNAIYLFDRGFPSVALIQTLENMGQKFVMRAAGSFLSEINEFSRSKARDKVIHIRSLHNLERVR